MLPNCSSSTPTPDVIVIGGGVVGLSTAWRLAGQGLKVRVLEQGQFGQESSWAGAGILPPGNPEFASTEEARLRAASHVLWDDWSSALQEESGIDNGYIRCGGLELRRIDESSSLESEIAAWRAEGVVVEVPGIEELRSTFPAIHPEISHGYVLPELGQVRNPRHLKALLTACELRGVDLRCGVPVVEFKMQKERVVSVRAPGEEHCGNEFVVAGGAWTTSLLRLAGYPEFKIEPVRGQIVLLEARPLAFRCVIQNGLRYLVPRVDGKILIGSTEEKVGFDKKTTAEGVAGLVKFACSLVPGLANAKFERAWAGLRPYAANGIPFLNRVPGKANLIVAAGHFRSGLQLSPISADIVARLILNPSS